MRGSVCVGVCVLLHIPKKVHCLLSAKAIFISLDAPKPAEVLQRMLRNELTSEPM